MTIGGWVVELPAFPSMLDDAHQGHEHDPAGDLSLPVEHGQAVLAVEGVHGQSDTVARVVGVVGNLDALYSGYDVAFLPQVGGVPSRPAPAVEWTTAGRRLVGLGCGLFPAVKAKPSGSDAEQSAPLSHCRHREGTGGDDEQQEPPSAR